MRFRAPRTAEAVGAFLASRRAMGCSPKTVGRYRYTLGRLEKAFSRVPDRPEAVETLLAGLGVGSESKHGFWRDLRAFYRWAHRRLGVRDVMVEVRAPLLRSELPRSLSDDQVDGLLALPLSRRDRALLTLFLDTGARLGEVAGLRWKSVSGEAVYVSGKTGGRWVPLSPAARALLVGLGDVEHLWLGGKGPLTTSGVQQVVRRALGHVGVAGGPHLLRHTFARLYITAGGDPYSLQAILGHQSVETTWVYTRLDLRGVQGQHGRYSPIARRSTVAAGLS